MTKFFLILPTILFVSSFAFAQDYEDNENYDDKFYQENFLPANHARIKPSEAMQAGIPKENIFGNSKRKNYYENAYDKEDDFLSQIEHEEEILLKKQAMPNRGDYSGYFKIGEPYEIFGISYIPQDYDHFEEVGVASWYGNEFHGRATANGEIYDSGDMTAAHRTLPLPSLIRVTNLGNGKSVIVRVNDRGPFAKNRVIDVSEKAAEELDFRDSGTANVKVELLRADTDEMLSKLKIKE